MLRRALQEILWPVLLRHASSQRMSLKIATDDLCICHALRPYDIVKSLQSNVRLQSYISHSCTSFGSLSTSRRGRWNEPRPLLELKITWWASSWVHLSTGALHYTSIVTTVACRGHHWSESLKHPADSCFLLPPPQMPWQKRQLVLSLRELTDCTHTYCFSSAVPSRVAFVSSLIHTHSHTHTNNLLISKMHWYISIIILYNAYKQIKSSQQKL